MKINLFFPQSVYNFNFVTNDEFSMTLFSDFLQDSNISTNF
jgi:hypothetical protein